jgi:hypothetical protein
MAEYQEPIPYDRETQKKIDIVAHNIGAVKEFIERAGKKDYAEDMIKEILEADSYMRRAVDIAKTINVNTMKLLREKAKLRGVTL